jgi:hypothetical protein
MFKIKPQHIEYLESTIDAFGIAYIHGDGNIFVDEKNSEYRKNWSSPSSKGSEYVLVFKKGDKLPETVEELMNAFYHEKENEHRKAQQPAEEKPVKSIRTKKKELFRKKE